MDKVVIDCVPFLYYLQYLVYRHKGNLSKRLHAMFNIADFLNLGLGKQLCEKAKGHVDTAFHVLAHCRELENRPDNFNKKKIMIKQLLCLQSTN